MRSFMSSNGRDIVDERRAGVVPGRAAGGKAILDHPLRERLGDDRPSVVEAALSRQILARSSSVVAGTMRSTIVRDKRLLASMYLAEIRRHAALRNA